MKQLTALSAQDRCSGAWTVWLSIMQGSKEAGRAGYSQSLLKRGPSLPDNQITSSGSEGASQSINPKISDAHVRFIKVGTGKSASVIEMKTLASRKIRESFALGLFSRSAKQDNEDGVEALSLPERVDSITLTHRRMSLADPGHYGGSGSVRKPEVRRATFSNIMRRQSIQQVSGSIRAVGRSFASSFGPSRQSFSRPRASMLTREAAHQSVPSALKSGSRDQIDQVSSNSRRHSVHFDHSLDSPPAAP
ncbi:hypothetical protein WJX75_008193 [Coccomyxa subellipsoidea]|uniref:Uncharacterized protein n=1 Tax=Coccomyxa subellipsoidea TaxID=248742 RepID=A0ABR2YGU4_9CHLO